MSSEKKYVYLKKGLASFGKLVEPDEVMTIVNEDLQSDWYESVFYYNQNHFNQLKGQTKQSIKGITDVKTDKIVLDFDSKDLTLSQQDAITAVKRLNKNGVNMKDIEIYFSGNAGVHLIVTSNTMFTKKQVETIAHNIAGDLKTFDPSLYDNSQILRVPWTRNQKSGLYKIPLSYEQLQGSIDDIKELASDISNVDTQFEWEPTTINPKLLETKKEEPKELVKLDFNLNERPKHWKDYKWALLNAVGLKENERHEALMRIAATCKGLGYNEDLTRAFCLSFDEKFQALTKKGPVQDLDSNILPTIFGGSWNGGMYSYKNDTWIQKYCDRIGLKPEDSIQTENTITIDNAFDLFKDYAVNIDELTIKTGIPSLDEKMRMTIGMSVGIVAPPGAGKCLGKDTPVMMYDGSIKPVQDIKVGDLLMGDDSTPRKVLSTCTGREQLYKVKQSNGDDYIVNESHILSLKGNTNGKQKKYQYGNVIDINVKDYLNTNPTFKKRTSGYKVPIDFNEKPLELDPYMFGLWIGDGTTTKSQLTINKKDVEILDFIRSHNEEKGLIVNFKEYDSSSKEAYTVEIVSSNRNNPFLKFLQSKNLTDGKYIPSEFLRNSRKNRLKLAAGILDTDGYLDSFKNTFELTSSCEKLSSDYVYLFRSLGFKVTRTKENKSYRSITREKLYQGTSIAYRLYITGDNLHEIPTKLIRKQAKKQDKQRYQDLCKIELEKLEIGDYYGFEIDGNKRFLLGDFTVTHNTTLALNILNYMSNSGEQSIFFSYDMYHALVFQKLVQKHLNVSSNEIFEKFKANDINFQQQCLNILKTEYKNVEFCFKTGQTPDDISNTIISVEEKTGKKVRLIVVDYNELVLSDISDPTAASAFVAQKLREIANTHNVCVVVLMQPNKLAGNPSDEITSYRSAKGSSALAQSVSIMIGVNRPGFDPKRPHEDQFITINCLKNRMGSLFSLDLGWSGSTGDIYELSDEQEDHLIQIRERKKLEKEAQGDGW